jgi:hypothetical protein
MAQDVPETTPKTIQSVEYFCDGEIDSLLITFQDGTHAAVANGDFSADNPALCVLAWCDAPPSNLGAADGQTIATLPSTTERWDHQIPMFVVAEGKEQGKQLPWFPLDDD